MQILLGVFQFGRLVKLIPQTVMTGFVNGLATIIFMAQLESFQEVGARERREERRGRGEGSQGELCMRIYVLAAVLAAVTRNPEQSRDPILSFLLPSHSSPPPLLPSSPPSSFLLPQLDWQRSFNYFDTNNDTLITYNETLTRFHQVCECELINDFIIQLKFKVSRNVDGTFLCSLRYLTFFTVSH